MNTKKKKRVLTYGFKLPAQELKRRNNVEVVHIINGSGLSENFGSINKGTLKLSTKIDYPMDLYKKLHANLAEFIISRLRSTQMVLKGETHYFTIDLFNVYFRFYYDILKNKNIDAVFFTNVPHLGPDLMLYYIAKEMNLEVHFFYSTLFANKMIIADSIETIGDYEGKEKINDEKIEIKKEFKKNLTYMSKWAIFSYRYPIKRIQILTANILTMFKYRKYISMLKKAISADVDYKEKFVYFPLHLQPEATTNPMGGIYSDQILAIEQLRRILPDDWYIYVKENPKQSDFKRSRLFFHRLKYLEKVKIVPSNKSTYELMRDAQFVATITGTAGWEAITGGKNVLLFGYCWYQNFTGVFRYDEKFKLEELLKHTINHEELQKQVNDFLNTLHSGIVNKYNRKNLKDFNEADSIRAMVDAMERVLL